MYTPFRSDSSASLRNWSANVVFPVPAPPMTDNSERRGTPPRIISSSPSIPMSVRSIDDSNSSGSTSNPGDAPPPSPPSNSPNPTSFGPLESPAAFPDTRRRGLPIRCQWTYCPLTRRPLIRCPLTRRQRDRRPRTTRRRIPSRTGRDRGYRHSLTRRQTGPPRRTIRHRTGRRRQTTRRRTDRLPPAGRFSASHSQTRYCRIRLRRSCPHRRRPRPLATDPARRSGFRRTGRFRARPRGRRLPGIGRFAGRRFVSVGGLVVLVAFAGLVVLVALGRIAVRVAVPQRALEPVVLVAHGSSRP